jgi:hypothetical protein
VPVLSQYERTVARFRRHLLSEAAATRREFAETYRDVSREISRRITVLLAAEKDDFRLIRLRELERQIEEESLRLVDQSTAQIENGQRTMARFGAGASRGACCCGSSARAGVVVHAVADRSV